MIRSILMSKTAKLLGTCVCPVVGAAGITMAVPKVRSAVHKATAPREMAAPKTIARPVSAAPAPCAVPPVIALGTETPAAFTDPIASFQPSGRNGIPGGLNDRDRPSDLDNPTPPAPDDMPTPVSAVPEPHAWLELIFGFALIGGSIRAAISGITPADEEIARKRES